MVPLDLGQRSQEITSFMILAFNPCNLYDNLNYVLNLRFAGGCCVGFASIICNEIIFYKYIFKPLWRSTKNLI